MVMCLPDGQWSADVTCEPIECKRPLAPENGQLHCAGGRLGQQCTASCDDGFNLVGTAVRTCGESGTFSGTAATCEAVQCPALKKPVGGAIDRDQTNHGERVKPKTQPRYNLLGTTCNVSCVQGFNMAGSHTRECQDTGSW